MSNYVNLFELEDIDYIDDEKVRRLYEETVDKLFSDVSYEKHFDPIDFFMFFRDRISLKVNDYPLSITERYNIVVELEDLFKSETDDEISHKLVTFLCHVLIFSTLTTYKNDPYKLHQVIRYMINSFP